MKEGSPVAVLTIGSRRRLSFYRKYDNGKEDVTEAEAAYEFEQTHGSLFVLDSLDEEPKCRRNMMGTRCDDALFLHSVKCPRDAGYFSVAFVFRCLERYIGFLAKSKYSVQLKVNIILYSKLLGNIL